MTKNPFYNATFAIAYIIGIVTLASFAPILFGNQKDNILMPMGMLALLVLSVAVMAYLFFYQPVIMLLDGERTNAVKLFLQTVGIFAGATVVVLLISILVSRLYL